VALLSLAAIYRLARARTVQSFGRLVARAETSERVVALTFDDGPVAARLDDVLGALRSRSVQATFFVTGGDLEAAPEAGRRLVAEGHQLGNHSYSHARMVFRSQDFIRNEIERTDRLIRAAGEQGDILFRPPYCWKLVGLPWFLWRAGRTTVTWDLEPDSYPEVATSPRRIADHVRDRVRPGSIVLLHVWWSSGDASRAAIPMIVDSLRTDGYRFLTLRELLQSS
jgi:peptidoglycan/xylan/chitin deacetylase (PgdA/CDA1 family)